jgi:ABC-2 type transport system permease protein
MKLLRDTWLVFERYLGLTLRNPAWTLIGMLQPILYLVLFAPLLKNVVSAPGFPQGGAYNIFVPGLLVQMGIFGVAYSGFSLIGEVRAGVIERMRVTPVSRLAMLLGRALRETLIMLVQSLLLIGLALPFGLTLHMGGLLVALTLQLLIGLLMASMSFTLALKVQSEDALAGVLSMITIPLLLLSGVLLPLSLAPTWLRNIAAANPLAYAVDASRAAFANHLSDPSVVKGMLIMAVLAIVSVLTAARAFSKTVA